MPARQRESQPYANETSSSSITFLFDLLGIVHSQTSGKGWSGGAAADLFSCRDNSLDLAADRWNRLGRETKRRTREISVLGRPGILLFLGVDLLGFLLPFQLLANEGELLILLLPELLS
jgi:hypothetical protein